MIKCLFLTKPASFSDIIKKKNPKGFNDIYVNTVCFLKWFPQLHVYSGIDILHQKSVH